MQSRPPLSSVQLSRFYLFFKTLAFVLISVEALAVPFDCENQACGLAGDGPYPNIVVGTITRVADTAEAKRVFHWARKQGFWNDLPDDPERFVREIQVLSLEMQDSGGLEDITLLMGGVHYKAVKMLAGDLVRYTPHDPDHSDPPTKDPVAAAYWKLFGCVAVLCRAEDLTCPARYTTGVYGLRDGVQLDKSSHIPVTGGLRIDPVTYLPLKAAGQ